MDNGQKTCTLNGKEKAIIPPQSFAALRDLIIAGQTNATRAMYAALGLSLRLRNDDGPMPLRYKGDPLDYGGQVMDWLQGNGADMNECDAAALECYRVCSAAYPSAPEVAEREDFSDPPAESSTASPS